MAINVYPPMAGATNFLSTADWQTQVSRGLVQGASVVNIYGYQPAVTTNYIPIWENATAYTYPVSAIPMTLYSSSASDTNVAILISGLDASFNQQSETLVLTNGTTGVVTAKNYLRINSISVARSPNPVGTIFLSDAGKVNTYAQINLVGTTSAGRSQMNIYTVPNGFTFYLARVNAYVSPNNNANFFANYRTFQTNNVTGASQFIQQAPFTTEYQTLRVFPRPYTQKTDIQWQCSMSAGTSIVSIGVEGVLIQGA